MTIILDNFPPSTLQGVGLGGRKNPRIIVGENYCHFGASYSSVGPRFTAGLPFPVPPILEFKACRDSGTILPPIFPGFTAIAFSTLRAKGTLISEPRFSTPCEMRFLPREKGKMAFVEGFSLKRPFSLSRVGKSHLQGVENRGSLISVPLALRGVDEYMCLLPVFGASDISEL